MRRRLHSVDEEFNGGIDYSLREGGEGHRALSLYFLVLPMGFFSCKRGEGDFLVLGRSLCEDKRPFAYRRASLTMKKGSLKRDSHNSSLLASLHDFYPFYMAFFYSRLSTEIPWYRCLLGKILFDFLCLNYIKGSNDSCCSKR